MPVIAETLMDWVGIPNSFLGYVLVYTLAAMTFDIIFMGFLYILWYVAASRRY